MVFNIVVAFHEYWICWCGFGEKLNEEMLCWKCIRRWESNWANRKVAAKYEKSNQSRADWINLTFLQCAFSSPKCESKCNLNVSLQLIHLTGHGHWKHFLLLWALLLHHYLQKLDTDTPIGTSVSSLLQLKSVHSLNPKCPFFLTCTQSSLFEIVRGSWKGRFASKIWG